MKVLFLDFDGVLNNVLFFLMQQERTSFHKDEKWHLKNVDPANMKALKFILDTVPELNVVISSAWGGFFKLGAFKEIFRKFKIDPKRVIGITPRKLSSMRCNEIHWWLQDYKEEHGKDVENYLALDDHDVFYEEEKKKEYLTDSSVGLIYPDVVYIIKYFNPEWKEPIVLL